ncbi:hypothetical protein [Francisella sp. SYW-2]|uniref:hypothetical protein n=1 Tax=Francisella sp. SYW-2 TaxID=2610886 RepID=UPI00123D8042|nr:hypothetical protein [Francisella sp. SYW-2]
MINSIILEKNNVFMPKIRTIKKGQYILLNKSKKKEYLLNFEEKENCALIILKNNDKVLFEYLTPNESSEVYQIIDDTKSPIKGIFISSINYGYGNIFEKIKKSFFNESSYLKYIHSKNFIDAIEFDNNGNITNLNSGIKFLLEEQDCKLLANEWNNGSY